MSPDTHPPQCCRHTRKVIAGMLMLGSDRFGLCFLALWACLACAAAPLAAADEPAADETNAAHRRWGSQVTGSGQPFNPMYHEANLTDGTSKPTLFGSKPRGLVGGAVTISLALPTSVSAVALTQAQFGGQFDRAKAVRIYVDGRRLPDLQLADAPRKRQRFPIQAAGQEFRIIVLRQYDAPDSDVGGWEEIELLTTEDLAAKFAMPDSFKPCGKPLIQPAREPVRVIGKPVAVEGHPRSLWTADELAALRRRLAADRQARLALDQLLRRADHLLATEVVIPPPAEVLDATGALRHIAAADAATDLALADALADKPACAEKAIGVLAAYARTFADYHPTGRSRRDPSRIFNRREEMAAWLIRIALAYDLLHARMSGSQRREIGDRLLRDAARFLAGEPESWKDHSTEQATVTAAVFLTGLACDDGQLATWGLDGRDGTGGARRIIESSVRDDGTWMTDPVSQPGPAAEAVVLMAECAWRQGVNLYSHAAGRLKRLLDAPLELAYPSLRLPALYRSGNDTLLGPGLVLYDFAARRYDDPTYDLLAAGLTPAMGTRRGSFLPWPLPEGDKPMLSGPTARGHAHLDAAGFAVLRTGRGRDRNQVLMVRGPAEAHSRPDVLGLDLYGLGRSLMPSPGASYVDEDRYRNWYQATVAHNTLAVDERPQVPSRATLSLLSATEDTAIARAWTSEAYPGVGIDRTVVLTRDYAVDLVAVFSRTPRTLDLTTHAFGKLTSSLNLRRRRVVSQRPGYRRMTGVAECSTEDAWQAVWTSELERPRMVMSVPAGPQTTVYTAMGWMGNHRVPLVIRRRTADQAAFAAVINLNRDEQFVSGVSWIRTGTPSARALSIATRRGTDILLVNYAPGTRSAGPIRTNARLAFVRTRRHLTHAVWRGGVESMYMAGGTRLEVLGNTVTLSTPALVACERAADEVLLLRNLAGPPTLLRAEGLDLRPTGGEDDPGYVVHAVDAYGHPPTGGVRLRFVENPVEERLPSGTGVALAKPGDSALADHRRDGDERFRIALQQARAGRLAALDRALLDEEEAARNPVAPSTAVIIEAEQFAKQGGGEVEVTDRKIGTHGGKAFLNWDEEGHWLEWPVNVPETGYYHIMFKSCSRDRHVRRRLEIDGKAPVPAAADFYLPYTGGWSNQRDDWHLVRLEDYRIGRPVLVYLTRGEHRLRLTNLNHSANLDYIVVASPDVPPERSEFE